MPLKLRRSDVTAAIGFALVAAFYFQRLTAYLVNDDEGSYLYAAWRISLGELPYRDFLTPQLPGFLLPGGALMALVGPDVWAARALAACVTLAAGAVVWATARRLFGGPVALVAGAIVLLHPDVYLECRTFRPEPFMLLYGTLGVALFTRGAIPRPGAGDPPDRRWLAASGAAFGLATLSKLFGPLPAAGCLMWLAADGRRRGRPVGAMARDTLAVVGPAVLVVAAGLGSLALASTPGTVFEAVLGHHLRQGRGRPAAEVLGKGVGFYVTFLRHNANALLVLVALAVSATAWRDRERRPLVFAWQLPTALVFLALSRELWSRHLIYLVPALGTLFGLGAWWLASGRATAADGGPGVASRPPGRADFGPPVAVALAVALLGPWALLDRDNGWREEDGTARVADFVALVTAPGEFVLSDTSELDFYARRPTTPSAASLSAGAASSGQITWARLEGDLAGRTPALVLVDRTVAPDGREYGHFRFLRDLDAFETWLDASTERAGLLRRDVQRHRVYTPRGRGLPLVAFFQGGPALLAAAPSAGSVASGGRLDVLTAWRADAPLADELAMTLRLVDGAGVQWAQADDGLFASPFRPTQVWEAGELTSDRLEIEVPSGTPPGTYRLELGLYRREGVVSLEATDAGGTAMGQRVAVGEVRVEPWRGAPAAGDLALDLRWDGPEAGGLRLLGRGPLPGEALAPGAAFNLELWWAVERPTADLAVRVTLGDSEVGSVAADERMPLGVPGAGSGTWPAGTVARQRLVVPVLGGASAGTYTLAATVVDAAGEPVAGAGPVTLGTLDVE